MAKHKNIFFLICYSEKSTTSVISKHKMLCCGSGYTWIWRFWIWIRTRNADTDPGAGKLTKFSKQTNFQTLKKAFVPKKVSFYDLLPKLFYFHVKIQLFVTAMSEQDPDPDAHRFGSLDPDPDTH